MDWISTGVGVAGSVIGGLFGGSARKKNDKLASENLQQAKDVYADQSKQFDQSYYGDYTQNAQVKQMLDKVRSNFTQDNTNNRNAAAITGASDASVQASTAQNSDSIGQAVAGAAAVGEQSKQSALSNFRGAQQNYLNSYNNYTQYKMGANNSEADQWGNLVTNATKMVMPYSTSTTTKKTA